MAEMHFDWQDRYSEASSRLKSNVAKLDLRKKGSPHNLVVAAKREMEKWNKSYPQLGTSTVAVEFVERLNITANPERRFAKIISLAEQRGVRTPVKASDLKHQALFSLMDLMEK